MARRGVVQGGPAQLKSLPKYFLKKVTLGAKTARQNFSLGTRDSSKICLLSVWISYVCNLLQYSINLIRGFASSAKL